MKFMIAFKNTSCENILLRRIISFFRNCYSFIFIMDKILCRCLVRKKASSPPPYFNIFVILTFAQTFAFLLYMDITTTVIKNQEGNKKISRHSKSNYKFLSILYKKHSGEILRSVSFYKLHKF